MRPMTLDEFDSITWELSRHTGGEYDRVALALKQREELLAARKLLLAGSSEALIFAHERPYGLDSPEQSAEANGLETGLERALSWAQGLFSEANHATDDADTG